jgi:hypothetical protein
LMFECSHTFSVHYFHFKSTRSSVSRMSSDAGADDGYAMSYTYLLVVRMT